MNEIDYRFWAPIIANILTPTLAVTVTWWLNRVPPATNETRTQFSRFWRQVLIVVLTMSGWLAFWTNTPKIDYFVRWGISNDPNKIWVGVEGHKLIGKKPSEVMVIARAPDTSVDHFRDTSIVRSGPYQISDARFRVEASFGDDFLQRMKKFEGIQYWLLLVPDNFPVESVHSLGDAEKYGAKILGSKQNNVSLLPCADVSGGAPVQ